MFHKTCVFLALACFSGMAFGDNKLPQVVTSEVFYDYEPAEYVAPEQEYVAPEPVMQEVPAWPLVGSDADVVVACGELNCIKAEEDNAVVQDEVKTDVQDGETTIVSKLGSGVVIENRIVTNGDGWSGGPNIENGIMIPAGFDNECQNKADMPLMRREMLEDDGGTVLAVSRSPRKKCNKRSDSYAVFAERAGFSNEETYKNDVADISDVSGAASPFAEDVKTEIAVVTDTETTDVKVNNYVDEEAPAVLRDQVRSWIVASGQTLRQVLQSWCDKEGWDLVWTTSREYPIEASAIFKGRFIDVASALVRNFERATPIPYAKFYKGNRVIVVSTSEE